jgi:limonene-1,2-epoxide hydrolase
MALTRDHLASLPASFFKAVDDRDVEGIVSHFAPHATFTVQTDHVTVTGVDEIRNMFSAFIQSSRTMHHEITNIIIDEVNRRVSTEQTYAGEMMDGTQNDMRNCNFFDVDGDGKFTRVMVWMAGANPLKNSSGPDAA